MKRAVLGFLFVTALSFTAVADDASDAKMAEDQIAHLEKVAAIVNADKTDCPKMTADVNRYVAENKAKIAAMKAWFKGLSEAQKKKLEVVYKARTEAAVRKLAEGLGKCATDKGVREAMKHI